LSCVVCGLETKGHAEWFLVIDNRWFDRVKIFSWHPGLARLGRLQSVCGRQHLRTLLAYWLTHASLQLVATESAPGAVASDPSRAGGDYDEFFLGKVVGELAVCRESVSRVWTGSPEALECILNAMPGEVENQPLAQPLAPEFPLLEGAMEYSRECALH
jgi:hypothetical protein